MTILARVTQRGLRLRRGPSTHYDTLHKLAIGDVVDLLVPALGQTWHKVRVHRARSGIGVDQIGYISADHIELMTPLPAPYTAP